MIAQSILVLEHYTGTNELDSAFLSKHKVVSAKWRDLWVGVSSGRRDALKFYRKRTSCKCLKKMHLEARKTTPKRGFFGVVGKNSIVWFYLYVVDV